MQVQEMEIYELNDVFVDRNLIYNMIKKIDADFHFSEEFVNIICEQGFSLVHKGKKVGYDFFVGENAKFELDKKLNQYNRDVRYFKSYSFFDESRNIGVLAWKKAMSYGEINGWDKYLNGEKNGTA